MGLPSDPANAGPVVTRLLNQAGAGDSAAAAKLLPLVYEHLRGLAGQKMSRERPEHTLSATALVHEAYLRLVDQPVPQRWDGRWHFFAAASEAMRRILVENARRRARLRHGGHLRRTPLDDGAVAKLTSAPEAKADDDAEKLLALDAALTRLAQAHPQKAKLVQLRYFAGLSSDQAAEALGISPATADRHWAYSRAWLYRSITSSDVEHRP